MLRTILNRSWRQHSTKQQLYGHLPPITKTIQVRRTRHAGHCWRSRDEHISDVLLWTPSHGRAKAGRPARTYIQQLCEETGCSPEDLPEAMNDRERWRVSRISVLTAQHDDDDDDIVTSIRGSKFIFQKEFGRKKKYGGLENTHTHSLPLTFTHSHILGCLRGLMVKVLDCDIVVIEFELHSRYNVLFRTRKIWTPLLVQLLVK